MDNQRYLRNVSTLTYVAEKCIGCGVCAVSCPEEALKLHRHERTPPFQTAMDLYGTVAKDNNRA